MKPFENVHSRAELEMDSRRIADIVSKELPRGVGFALFVYSFGAKGNLAYISNGDRAGMIETVKEWIAKQESATPPDKTLKGHWTPDGVVDDKPL